MSYSDQNVTCWSSYSVNENSSYLWIGEMNSNFYSSASSSLLESSEYNDSNVSLEVSELSSTFSSSEMLRSFKNLFDFKL